MWYHHDRCLYNRIADANWQGRYYAFVLPADPQFGKDPCGYQIVAYEMLPLAGDAYENRKIAGMRLRRGAAAQAECD
jgi:hypothetical protein